MKQPLKIAIDASRSTVEHATGTEYYSRQMIRYLIEVNEEQAVPHHLHLYFRDKPVLGLFPNYEHVHCHVIPFPRLWTHLRFALAISQTKPDVTFVPAHTLPRFFTGRAVVTVHDLGYHHFPEAHPEQQRRYLEWSTRHSANRASLILADSQATAQDLQTFYQTPSEKIRVVYPGVERPPDSSYEILYDKYSLPMRYFLFIGTLQPRKNIARLIAAYGMWQRANPDKTIGLVLAGKKGWLFDEAWLKGVENVHVLGYVEDSDKGELLHHAEALVFPSLYEGFGFPVIEAMLCGTPVIASNSSSLPELVGDAGILVNPLEVREIAAALDLVSNYELLRRKIGVKGLLQAQNFTWRTAAEQCLRVLEEAAI